MMFAGIGQIDRVVLFGDQRETKHIAVILGLFADVGGFLAGVRYLPHCEHGGRSLSPSMMITGNSGIAVPRCCGEWTGC
jgi:hypothetical protein